MSLILDALKKADQERKEEQAVPSIDATHPNLNAVKNNQGKYFIIAVVSVLAVIILLITLIFILFSNKNAVSNSNNIPSVVGHATNSSTHAANPRAHDGQAHVNREAPTARPREQVYREAPAAVNPATANNEINAQRKKLIDAQYQKDAKTVQVDDNVSGLYSEPQAESVAQKPAETNKSSNTRTQQKITGRDSATTANAIPQSQAPTTITINLNALSGYPAINLITDLPNTVKKSIPTLMYSAHYYKDNGGSYIVINGREVREKNSIEGGVRVTKILKDGTLFSVSNNKFKMKARNSWLNF